MQSIIKPIFLGIIQGLTEFLPISSSGHLIIVPKIFDLPKYPLFFDTTLHLGTAAALIIYFWKDLIFIVKGKNFKLLKFILIGSIPAGAAGFLFEDYFENVFRSILSVSMFLILGSILMLLAEYLGKHTRQIKDILDLDGKKSFIIGIFQSLALFPGVSRSGATISGGMFMGLDRQKSAKFSFLLSIPVVLGAGLFKLLGSAGEFSSVGLIPVLLGFFASFFTGLLVIKFLLNFLNNNSLKVFIVYRILLAGVLLGFFV